MNTSSDFWENYYATHRNPVACSLFAEFVTPFLKKGELLVEFGCGNARDSVHFAKQGVNVMAIDQCTKEIGYLNQEFADLGNISFLADDMTRLSPNMEKSDYLYSRFTLHAIDKESQSRVFNWSSANLKSGGLFFIEVRSVKDDLFGQGESLKDNAFFTDHYRRFIVLDEMLEEMKECGFKILYSQESNGLAPFKDKDPIVIRIIAQK